MIAQFVIDNEVNFDYIKQVATHTYIQYIHTYIHTYIHHRFRSGVTGVLGLH
jgi:hypothetical protein